MIVYRRCVRNSLEKLLCLDFSFVIKFWPPHRRRRRPPERINQLWIRPPCMSCCRSSSNSRKQLPGNEWDRAEKGWRGWGGRGVLGNFLTPSYSKCNFPAPSCPPVCRRSVIPFIPHFSISLILSPCLSLSLSLSIYLCMYIVFINLSNLWILYIAS